MTSYAASLPNYPFVNMLVTKSPDLDPSPTSRKIPQLRNICTSHCGRNCIYCRDNGEGCTPCSDQVLTPADT